MVRQGIEMATSLLDALLRGLSLCAADYVEYCTGRGGSADGEAADPHIWSYCFLSDWY